MHNPFLIHSKIMKFFIMSILLFAPPAWCLGQSPLFIPQLLEGTTFNLNVQTGTMQFWPGINTPTFGVNGNILGPTLLINKGDEVTLNVTNNLSTTTTMHWHGLHVSAMNDGGPHQIIQEGATWSPQFEVKNNAGTFWYHPHGENKTDMQVSKGIAGMIIIKDSEEAALELPRTYGVDDFPLIVQTKSFDVLHQIQIATHADTLVMVNATVNAYLNVPAQVVRFRLLAGSSERTFNFGFSNDMNFYQIATDGGLKEIPYQTNRLKLSPGERAEILVDLSTLEGEGVYLMSYGSELTDGIMGALNVGIMASPEGYAENPMNGADFNLLMLNVGAPTANAINTIPASLVSMTDLNVADSDVERNLLLSPMEMGPVNAVEGPFGINNVQFQMEVVNEIVHLGDVEIWTITNQTQVAHPFHIHDVEFQIIDYNGDNPPPDQQGWKDVVLVMPQQSVSFITKFQDYADPDVPYMYHCHLLHHEDEGMMGSFVVIDPNAIEELMTDLMYYPYPNPANLSVTFQLNSITHAAPNVEIIDANGKVVKMQVEMIDSKIVLQTNLLPAGFYTILVDGKNKGYFIKE
jgi:blue copper oxidase